MPFYETFWDVLGMREYEFIYHRVFKQELKEDLGILPDKEFKTLIQKHVREVMQGTSLHFGEPSVNPATRAGMYRMLLKKLAKDYGKEFPVGTTAAEKPWWL